MSKVDWLTSSSAKDNIKKVFAALLLLLGIMLLLHGCGYSLKGTGSFLPEYIKKISLPEFENRTTKLDLEKILSEKIQEEFLSRGTYDIVTDIKDADAVLEGDILSYRTVPKSVDAQGRATSYLIRITVSAKFRDLKTDKLIYEDNNYQFSEEYQLSETEEDFFEQEEFALAEAAEKFATALVSAILEGF